jgi:hypothetical protein
MAAVSDRTRERVFSAAIVGLAVIAALWILCRPTLPQIPPVLTPQSDSAPSSPDTLLAPIEVIDLPQTAAPAPTPPPARASVPAPAPRPASPPAPASQSAPIAPAKVVPEPVPQPKTIVEAPPPSVHVAAPAPPIAPLRPEPVHVQLPQAVTPLLPDLPQPVPQKAFRALAPDAEPAPPTRDPLKVTDDDLARFRAAREEAKVVPLKSDDDPLPEPMHVTPMKPEAVPPRAVQVAAETPRKVLAPEPPPEPPAPPMKDVIKPASPVKAAPVAAPPKPVAPPLPHVVTTATIGEGRTLLRMLEQGSGPGIQIGWPSQPAERDTLYRLFVQCFGMRVGLADSDGRLYLADGKAGEPSEFDAERYSGFVRRPEGAMAADEQREVTRLANYHHTGASPVRVFPRHVDAYLMSGLRQAVGENYLSLRTIRARYRLRNGQVIVDSITADGRSVDGTIDLGTVASGCGN